MTRFESSYKPTMFMALLCTALLTGGGIGRLFAAVAPGVAVAPGTLVDAATEPTVISATPSNKATDVPTSTNTGDNVVIGTETTATFSQPMDPATVNALTFTVKETTGNDVPGSVVMDEANTVATFTPNSTALNPNTSYTATVTMAAKNASCNGQSHCMEIYDQRGRVYWTEISTPWNSRYFRDSDEIRNHRRFCICYQWGCWS
jgi:hypothetical protein